MSHQEPVSVYCPYCGQPLEIMVDCSVESQSYIEDCQVCCRPMVLNIHVSEDGEPDVEVKPENE